MGGVARSDTEVKGCKKATQMASVIGHRAGDFAQRSRARNQLRRSSRERFKNANARRDKTTSGV
eukprot:4237830-Alexandrium_andersonii.AAC.1